MTVGELMAKCLQAEGVTFMCGIVDGAHIPLVSKLGDYGIDYLTPTTRRRPPTSPRPMPASDTGPPW